MRPVGIGYLLVFFAVASCNDRFGRTQDHLGCNGASALSWIITLIGGLVVAARIGNLPSQSRTRASFPTSGCLVRWDDITGMYLQVPRVKGSAVGQDLLFIVPALPERWLK